MENVNTIELNGQLYDIEDTTARTTAEQNSKELVKVKETANSAQQTATTAQASANTASTSADEAKALATTAQTTADEAKESAATKQPLLGNYDSLSINPGGEDFLSTTSVESLTNIILNKTEANVESMVLLENAITGKFEILGTISIYQSAGTYYFGLKNYNSKIELSIKQNKLYVKNNSTEDIEIFFIPQGFMNV